MSEPKIGEAIFIVRRYRNMSQVELAARSGIHANSIMEIERGRRNPGWGALVKISAGLDVELSRLIKKAESIKPPL